MYDGCTTFGYCIDGDCIQFETCIDVDGYHTVLNLTHPDLMHNVCGINIICSCNDNAGNVDMYFLEPVGESTRISEALDSSTMPGSLTSLTSVSDRPINSSESHEVSNSYARKSTIETSSIVACPADISSLRSSPPKKKKKLVKKSNASKPPGKSKKGKSNRNLANAKTKDVSEVNELKYIIHGSPSVDKIFLNQKKAISLLVRNGSRINQFNLAAGGISKSGIIRWVCARKNCKSYLQIKIDKSLILSKRVGSRQRFEFEKPDDLKVDHVKNIIGNSAEHSCSSLSEPELKELLITVLAKQMTTNLTQTGNIPARSEIVRIATDQVIGDYDNLAGPLNLPKLSLPRKISRIMSERNLTSTEITLENFRTYNFDDHFSMKPMILDVEFATQTRNEYLLFFNKKTISKLVDGQHNCCLDGTFPLGRSQIYNQTLQIFATNGSDYWLVASVWMHRHTQQHYDSVFKRLSFLNDNKALWVVNVTTDREQGLINSFQANFNFANAYRCSFHSLDSFHKEFTSYGLKIYMPARNKIITSNEGKIISHIWRVVSITPFLPTIHACQLIDYIKVHTIPLISDDTLEIDVETVLTRIRNTLMSDPSISYFSLITKNIIPLWTDTTNNIAERANGALKYFLNNHVKSTKIIEKIRGSKIWADRLYQQNLVYSSTANRKPSKFTKTRRQNIIEIIKLIQNSDLNSALLEKIDEFVWSNFDRSQTDE